MRLPPADASFRLTAARACVLVPVFALAVAAGGCATADRAAEPALSLEQREKNVESFDVLWSTVKEQHWDPTLGGVDWDAVKTELRPRVESAETMSAARAVMFEALSRLEQSHFGLVPSEVYTDVQRPAPSDDRGEPGLVIRAIDGEGVVVSVDPGSPAERAGVRPGWRIDRVGDVDIAARLERVAATYAGSTRGDLAAAGMLSRLLRGARGSQVTIQFTEGSGASREMAIERGEPRGRYVQFGNMPPAYVWFESRKLDGGAGYIAFNLFLDPDTISRQFEEAIHAFRDAPGIVLDLRGNVGGLGGMSMGMAGWFTPDSGELLGNMKTRNATIRFAVFPRPEPYNGKLAILVDGLTASTSEILAGGMKDLGRARVFGQRTAGAALPSIFSRLPNNDGLQYAIADYFSAGGARLEGVGVEPDEEVRPTRADLLAGRDPVLERALAWVRDAATASARGRTNAHD